MLTLQVADAVEKSGRQHGVHRHREVHAGPARSETPGTLGNLHGNRGVACHRQAAAGGLRPDSADARSREVRPVHSIEEGRTNLGERLRRPWREGAEGTPRTASTGRDAEPGNRVTGAGLITRGAKRSRRERFTSLMHHVTPDLLAWHSNSSNSRLRPALMDDMGAVCGGTRRQHRRPALSHYRAKPSRCQYIRSPTTDNGRSDRCAGGQDRAARAMAEVLNAVYERGFLGFSYGFRLGRTHKLMMAAAHSSWRIWSRSSCPTQSPVCALISGLAGRLMSSDRARCEFARSAFARVDIGHASVSRTKSCRVPRSGRKRLPISVVAEASLAQHVYGGGYLVARGVAGLSGYCVSRNKISQTQSRISL
jgi:hypothetical protein